MEALAFENQNTVVKGGEHYLDLPAHVDGKFITCKFQLNRSEVKEVVRNKTIDIDVLHMSGPVQPMEIFMQEPDLPIPLHTPLNCNPRYWNNEKAILTFRFGRADINLLKETGCIWVIIANRNTPMLPIQYSNGIPAPEKEKENENL